MNDERKKSKLKFVSLHGHDVLGSPLDAIGYPSEYMDFAYENGMDAIAFTNHGNCNGLSYQALHIKEMKKQGKDFKTIYGVEAYYHPDLDKWREDYKAFKELKKDDKDDDEEATLNFEDEERDYKRAVNRRHHLALLAQNQKGLNNIFSLVTKSYRDENFYRFPRIDKKLLREHGEGIIVTSACLSGPLSGDFWRNRHKGGTAVKEAMRQTCKDFMEMFGDKFYGEIQFHDIIEQHIINLYVIELSREMGFPLVATCDHHYPRPELWKTRYLYKNLLRKSDEDKVLPDSVDEVGYDLYPRNGDQLFDYFKTNATKLGVLECYDIEEVKQAIETSYHIAHDRIEDFFPENKIKLPDFVIEKGKTPEQQLYEETRKGFAEKMKKGLIPDPEKYAKRIAHELGIIRQRGFEEYFLTMKWVVDFAWQNHFVGPGRGSGVGSVVDYLLGITTIDPVKYDLLFSRFLNEPEYLGPVHESGVEIDTEVISVALRSRETIKATPGSMLKVNGRYKAIEHVCRGDVINGQKVLGTVKDKARYKIRHIPENTEKELDGILWLNPNPSSLPDIDLDFSRPLELKQSLIDEKGSTCVVPITNYTRLKPKSTIKDVGRWLGLEFSEVNKVTKKMVHEATGPAKRAKGMTAGAYEPTLEEIEMYSNTYQRFCRQHPEISELAKNLISQVRSISRHAGGVVISNDLTSKMPLIRSKGVTQTPWSEGQTVRHLEPLGFVKFDILGLTTLEIIEKCIHNILKYRKGIKNPTFEQIKEWYEDNISMDAIDVDDQRVYKNVFHEGKWAGVFQFTEAGAQEFCTRMKPESILDLTAITTIQRPGPLSAGVDADYKDAKDNPHNVFYYNDIHKKYTEETHGFLLYQEQIAMLAHELGEGITLKEGNKLRKILTKKGNPSVEATKKKIYTKFITGCVNKGMTELQANELWETFIYFSGYGFNKSHAVAYASISYQCAYLLTYFEAEWLAAYLDAQDKTNEKKKLEAISTAKSLGYTIGPIDVNKSTGSWGVGEDKELVQSFITIKGFGEATVEELDKHRPFTSIEDLLYREEVNRQRLDISKIDTLCRIEALDSIIKNDDRFTGYKHLWCSINQKPKQKKKETFDDVCKRFAEVVEKCDFEGDFSRLEKINNRIALTGNYPVDLIVSPVVVSVLDEMGIPPISEQKKSGEKCWFVVTDTLEKKTRGGKPYLVLTVIDSSYETRQVNLWGYNPKRDHVKEHVLYVAAPRYQPEWGHSFNGFRDKKYEPRLEEIEL